MYSNARHPGARLSTPAAWRWIASIMLLGLAAGCCGPRPGNEKPPARIVSFDSGETGKSPSGFSPLLTGEGGPGVWALREDASAPGGGKILVQESAEAANYRFPVCIYDAVTARDVAVEVKFKAISGKLDQAGGLALRQNADNYYIARANALEDNVILFKMVNGKRSKIEEVPVKVTPGKWHTLRFEAAGRLLKITFDGKVVLERMDSTFTGPGKVGLWTKADSVTAFADFKIEPAP